jgi:3-oxoacyl-[acyl-carrier protein] reductase
MTTAMRAAGADDPVPVQALPRLGKSQEIADVVSFLLSDEAGFVTGCAWAVDGGANA